MVKAIKRAKTQGVFIVSTALSRDYGFETCGANRNPDGNLNNPENYEAGAFFKERSESSDERIKKELLLVPMDHRTVADYTDGESYRYEGNDGGMSWSTPWLAGMYALAKQADPNITPEKFWAVALSQSDECNNNDTETNIGRIMNPQKLINEIVRLKDSNEPVILEEGTDFEYKLSVTNKNDKKSMSRQQLSEDEINRIIKQKQEELKTKYKSNNIDIIVNSNDYGDISYKVQTKTNS